MSSLIYRYPCVYECTNTLCGYYVTPASVSQPRKTFCSASIQHHRIDRLARAPTVFPFFECGGHLSREKAQSAVVWLCRPLNLRGTGMDTERGRGRSLQDVLRAEVLAEEGKARLNQRESHPQSRAKTRTHTHRHPASVPGATEIPVPRAAPPPRRPAAPPPRRALPHLPARPPPLHPRGSPDVRRLSSPHIGRPTTHVRKKQRQEKTRAKVPNLSPV